MKYRCKGLIIQALVILILLPLLFTSCGGEKVKPHILLITIDTLRRDHVGAYGYHRETSPFLDQLAAEGVIFKNVITPIPVTAGSHASILTSLHPLSHNVTLNGVKLHPNVQTIAEVLKKNGYYTIGTVAVGVLRGNKNFNQGFDSFSDRWKEEAHVSPKFPLAERTAPSVNKSLFRQIDDYLSQHNQKPLFIWVHYYDPHGPYYEQDHITFTTKRREGTPKSIDKYDKEIRYTDDHIKALYNYLEEKGLSKGLVTCITADHGEQFGEHGYTNGHVDFYSENTYVPLILHGHKIPKQKTIETHVSTMDIGVTLLGMAGLKFDYPTEGIDLKQLIKKPDTYPDRKFLLIGSPMYARSLQLLGFPFAYILNFDPHYRYWYLSYQPAISLDENRFKPLGKDQIETLDNKTYALLPQSLDKGRNYVVLRADIPRNEGLSVKINVKPFLMTDELNIPGRGGKIRHLELVYPVTVLDRLRVIFHLKENTGIDNFRYTFIKSEEFPGNVKFTRKIENKIYKTLLTQRKKKEGDELFDLSADIEMEKNQIKVKKFKPTVIEYKKLIYTVFKYYSKRKDRILSGREEDQQLSEEDKKILETLGYL